MTIRAPREARWIAISRPIPREEPVTIATRSWRGSGWGWAWEAVAIFAFRCRMYLLLCYFIVHFNVLNLSLLFIPELQSAWKVLQQSEIEIEKDTHCLKSEMEIEKDTLTNWNLNRRLKKGKWLNEQCILTTALLSDVKNKF